LNDNLRTVAKLAIRRRNRDVETWPDGRGITDQPEILVRAFAIVDEFADAFEKGEAGGGAN